MSKKGFLITETNLGLKINEETINEGQDKRLYVEGIFSSFGRRNNNGRVYEEGVMKREVDKVLEKVDKKCLWGELGHPPNPEINPDKIAIRVESLGWDGQDLYGKAKIIDTPQGLIAKTLVREGSIGISSRGLGTVSENGTVNEDYQLVTWDLVTDPSNGPSWVKGIYEGKTWELGDKFDGKDEEELEEIHEHVEKMISLTEATEVHYNQIKKFIKELEKNM